MAGFKSQAKQKLVKDDRWDSIEINSLDEELLSLEVPLSDRATNLMGMLVTYHGSDSLAAQCDAVLRSLMAEGQYSEARDICSLMLQKVIPLSNETRAKFLELAHSARDFQFIDVLVQFTLKTDVAPDRNIHHLNISNLLHTFQVDAAVTAMNELHSQGKVLSPQLYSLMLKSLVGRERHRDAFALWTHITEHSCANTFAHLYMIKSAGMLGLARDIFAYYEACSTGNKRISPQLTIACVLAAVNALPVPRSGRLSDLHHHLDVVLNDVYHHRMVPSEEIYTQLVKYYARSGDWVNAEFCHFDLLRNHHTPTHATFYWLLEAYKTMLFTSFDDTEPVRETEYTRLGVEVRESGRLFSRRLTNAECKAVRSSVAAATDYCNPFAAISGLHFSDNLVDSQEYWPLQRIHYTLARPSDASRVTQCSIALTANQLVTRAVQCFSSLLTHHEVPEYQVYMQQLTILTHANRPDEAVRLFKAMCKVHKVRKDAYSLVISMFNGRGDAELSQKFLEQSAKRAIGTLASVSEYSTMRFVCDGEASIDESTYLRISSVAHVGSSAAAVSEDVSETVEPAASNERHESSKAASEDHEQHKKHKKAKHWGRHA